MQDTFTPSGYMGDYDHILLNSVYNIDPHTPPSCIKVTYTFANKKWAGIYWQYPSDNWGDFPGENLSKRDYKRIIFWAKGETGTEVVEFKSGGINSNEKNIEIVFQLSLDL